MVNIKSENKVLVICPTCKSKKELTIPESKLNHNSPLTTISLPKGVVCPHHFQMFIDKTYKIRGYQKVDLELEPDIKEQQKLVENRININRIKDDSMLKDLSINSKKVEYYPKNLEYDDEKEESKTNIVSKNREMSLEEIYQEFREFINEDNETFKEFIEKDKKRKKGNIDKNLIEYSTI